MSKLRVHKIGSVVYRLGFEKDLEITTELESRSGQAIVVRALSEKRIYSELELASGRMSKIFRGDLILGALGRRRALRGFAGEVPESVAVGDELAVLNRGGVIGSDATDHKDLGSPVACEVVGMPLLEGRAPNIADVRLPRVGSLDGLELAPVVIVSGSCMDSGKTLFLSELTQELSKQGFAIAGGKLTGVACLRDLVSLEDHGATVTASFLDCGHASTAGLSKEELEDCALSIIAWLSASKPDLIVLELGDGVIGDYGSLAILESPLVREAVRLHAYCATDLAGAWGGMRFLEERGIDIDLFSGPATDNLVGVEYLVRTLGRPALNAFRTPERLAELVRSELGLSKK